MSDLDQHIHERLLTIENSYSDMDEVQQEEFREAYKDTFDGARVVVRFYVKELVLALFEGFRGMFKRMRGNNDEDQDD